jgi:hypothetical protein
MNEPHGVAAETLALSFLAGMDDEGELLVKPKDLTHISYASSTLWPIAPTSSIFGFKVPDGNMLIWTYVSLYTTLANETSPAINFGFNFDATLFLAIQGASGAFLPFGPSMFTQGLINKPILLVFDPLTTPRIIFAPNGSAQAAGSLRVEAAVNGYLLPAGIGAVFKRYATKFVS